MCMHMLYVYTGSRPSKDDFYNLIIIEIWFHKKIITIFEEKLSSFIVIQSERQTLRLKPMQVDKDDRSSSSSKKYINKYFASLNIM